ncbi:hypothetical protein [Variovorax sp. PAMC 28711]|uniref:hypothetical protein n=1 Tax=Variovorax sp. PAMC 28711 TaxID=1795631 RepID=UPI0012E82795|nr:hypothetical protein [Variovorax sp. PAMC 28711]
MISSLALVPMLLGIFSVAALLGRSRSAVMVGCFGFGAGVWLLHGAVAPAHRSMVLPGLLLWPFVTPACAALLWWGRASPQPPRWFGAAFAIVAVALAMAGALVVHLVGA